MRMITCLSFLLFPCNTCLLFIYLLIDYGKTYQFQQNDAHTWVLASPDITTNIKCGVKAKPFNKTPFCNNLQ